MTDFGIALLFVVGALWWLNALVYYLNAMTRIEMGLPARGHFAIAIVAGLGGLAFMVAATVGMMR